MENLELKMYFFVPYNISEIAKGIQCGHASIEYMMKFWKELDCIDFRENWKTWIILNGGTTNSKPDEYGKPLGSLNQIHQDLWHYGVNHALFHEPDLQDALTSICFICDERVFNKELYPDFMNWLLDVKMYPEAKSIMPKMSENMLRRLPKEKCQELFPEYYQEWLTFIGGTKNEFLRELLKDKRLA